MILADENIHTSIISALRSAGIEVYSIYESNRGLKDSEIIDVARNMRFSILTEDKDFGEWVFAHHIRDISVIFSRYSFSETKSITQILCDYLKRNIILHPVFITLTISKVRVRQL